MKNTHKILGIFHYVFFSFVMLYSNSINSQQKERKILKEVSSYFGKLKKDGIQACLDSDPDLYKAAKKDKRNLDILMMACNDRISHYGLYESDTKKVLTTLYKNQESNFIIVNMKSLEKDPTLYTNPTLTLSRKENEKKTHIIYNHYEFDKDEGRHKLIKDSLSMGFNPDEKMELIEDYLYNTKENAISEKKREQPISRIYYVIAKINGKFLIKKLYDYTPKN